MTEEEKAKAYDEALERMKSWVRGEHPECFTEAQKAAEFIFPELAESEDEKMMNQLHSWMKEFGGAEEYTEKVYRWIKGLFEKQGEKTIPNMSPNNDNDTAICNICEEGRNCSKSNYVKSHCWRRE